MPTCANTLSETIAAYMDGNPKAVLYGMGVADGETWALGLGQAAQARHPNRCWDAPASEASLTGMLVGLSDLGWHGILVHCRSNFMWLGADALVNHAFQWDRMYGRKPRFTIVSVVGDTPGQGAQHDGYRPILWLGFESLSEALKYDGMSFYEVPLSRLRAEAPCESAS